METEGTVTGRTASEWGLQASNFAGIPEQHRIYLRSEVLRMYPLLSDDLRAKLGMDYPELVSRVDQILDLSPQRLKTGGLPDRKSDLAELDKEDQASIAKTRAAAAYQSP
jgi:hypothetical protein